MAVISTCDHWKNPSVQVWGRTGETNKKQTDLAGDLLETAIQTIPKGSVHYLHYLGHFESYNHAALSGTKRSNGAPPFDWNHRGLHRYCDQSAPVSSLHTRMVPPRCGFRNPKDNARVSARSHKQDVFLLHCKCRPQHTKPQCNFYQRSGIY